MINTLMQIVAPHYCYGCGKIGGVLCENCKNDIVYEVFSGCIVCGRPADGGVCGECTFSYERAWCIGERLGSLQRVIDAYKFERVVDAGSVLASLLSDALPAMPNTVVVTNVPTIHSHIRRRGYDHASLIAKRFAKLRGLRYDGLLHRLDENQQRGHNKKDRYAQAATAFRCNTALDPDAIYLLIDDIVTTNASLRFAASELINASAKTVWVAVVARQPLDK